MNGSTRWAVPVAIVLMATLLGCTLLVQVTPTPGAAVPASTTTSLVRTPLPRTTTPVPGLPTSDSGLRTPDSRLATPTGLYLTPDDIDIYPGPGHYAGDRISVQVQGHNAGRGPGGAEVTVTLDGPDGHRELAHGPLGGANLAGEAQQVFPYVWDTSGASGTYTVTVTLAPGGLPAAGETDRESRTASVRVDILPESERPPAEIGAHWAVTTTVCCAIHYVTGTAAERDLAQIVGATDQAIADDAQRMQTGLGGGERLDIFLIPKVLGQGGYADGAITISYLDRLYSSDDFAIVMRHEGVHLLDHAIASQRVSLLAEGLAVYISGGHFKPEPVDQRAAELLRMGRAQSLRDLADNFYSAQHETAYLEGASFISFLVDRYGWDEFKRFYAASGSAGGGDAERLDRGLQDVYGLSLDEADAAWRTWLAAMPPDPVQARDLTDTLRFFDAMRAYQLAYDPKAHFLRGWLPDMNDMRKRGEVATIMRHPEAPENVALEAMLVEAWTDLAAGRYDETEASLDAIEGVVATRRFDAQPMAAQYLAIVRALAADGYAAQRISLTPGASEAEAWVVPADASGTWPALEAVKMVETAGAWHLAR